jgi:hypothetical protein
LEKKGKSFIITASALVIVFAVMIAALAYNPQGSASGARVIEVHGFVFDEGGRPLENACVVANDGFAWTNADGSYSFTYNYSDEFISDSGPINNYDISAGAEGHWSEIQYLDITDAKSYEFNFTLPKNENMTVPLGVIVYPNMINGSTMVNISVKLGLDPLYASIDGDPEVAHIMLMFNSSRSADDPQYFSFSMQSTSGTPVQLFMNATVTGAYKGSGHVDYLIIIQNGPVFAAPLSGDRINYSDVSSNCTTFQLSPGESKDVEVMEPYDGFNDNLFDLPNIPSLSFNFDLMGKNITVQETKICNMNNGVDCEQWRGLVRESHGDGHRRAAYSWRPHLRGVRRERMCDPRVGAWY